MSSPAKTAIASPGCAVERDSAPVTLTLRRTDEPPPPVAAGRAGHARGREGACEARADESLGSLRREREQQRCVALHPAHGPHRRGARPQVVGGTGRPVYDEVHAEAAMTSGRDRPRWALELLNAAAGASRQHLVAAARRAVRGRDRAKALKFAEEAAVQARAMDQPDRSGAMAKAGAVLVRLGARRRGSRWSTRPPRPLGGWGSSAARRTRAATSPERLHRSL